MSSTAKESANAHVLYSAIARRKGTPPYKDHPVQAFLFDWTYKALSIGIKVRQTWRPPYDSRPTAHLYAQSTSFEYLDTAR